jgi:hypothetical protein
VLVRFLLRPLPVFLLTVALSALGFEIAPEGLTTAAQLGLLCVALILYAGWVIFRDAIRWNLILLVGLGFTAGLLTGSYVEPHRAATPSIVAVLGLTAAAISGRIFRIGFDALGRALLAGTSLYWMGLIVLPRLSPDPLLQQFWVGGGFVLFTGLTASWFARLRTEELHTAYIQQAGELYLLALNLWLGARLLTR